MQTQEHRFYILTRPTGEWPTFNMKRREGYFPELPPMELGSAIDAFVTRYFPGETVQDYGRCWGQPQDRCSVAIDYSPTRLRDYATH